MSDELTFTSVSFARAVGTCKFCDTDFSDGVITDLSDEFCVYFCSEECAHKEQERRANKMHCCTTCFGNLVVTKGTQCSACRYAAMQADFNPA